MPGPELADRLQRVGEYLRFRSSIPPRLNEFAILVTARQWDAQYEWHAHASPPRLQAGLNPAEAADLAEGRGGGMQVDETIVYDFCTAAASGAQGGDATYKAALDKFGERGVMDLIAVSGCYVLVSMTLNVDRTPVPGDAKPPHGRCRDSAVCILRQTTRRPRQIFGSKSHSAASRKIAKPARKASGWVNAVHIRRAAGFPRRDRRSSWRTARARC